MMRGMSRTTRSHAAMRAASAVSETGRDEPREVIEAVGRIRRLSLSAARSLRLGDYRGDLDPDESDDQIRRLAAWIRTDAVAGWTRIPRVGNEPCGWSRCGAPFRWIYLPFALH